MKELIEAYLKDTCQDTKYMHGLTITERGHDFMVSYKWLSDNGAEMTTSTGVKSSELLSFMWSRIANDNN